MSGGARCRLNGGVLDQASGDGWHLYHGDCCEVLPQLPADSIDFAVFSPPFVTMFVYSSSLRDLGNARTFDEFTTHFSFVCQELFRVIKPGRLLSMHCMDYPTVKGREGYIGLRDFRGLLISTMQQAGWIWHSSVVIQKDPVTQMYRTKSIGLLYKQLKKDSSMSRMGIPDYICTFRKPGINAVPIAHSEADFPLGEWQKIANPVWTGIHETDIVPYRDARDNDDEHHIAPLQLEVIRRCLLMWSNPGEVVLSPFAGVGSEGFMCLGGATMAGRSLPTRKFIGIELKRSYYEAAVRRLTSVSRQSSLLPDQ